MVDPSKYGTIVTDKRKKRKVEFPVRYSKELSGLIYFELWGRGIPRRRGKVMYHKYWGLHLSSFRLVEVLVPLSLKSKLVDKKNYILLRNRINKNGTIILKARDLDNDNVIWILDRDKLKRITGKNGTIPERLLMRLKTLDLKWRGPSETIKEVIGCSLCGILILSKLGDSEWGIKLMVPEGDDPRLPSIIKYLSDKYLVFKYGDRCTVIGVSSLLMKDLFKILQRISMIYPDIQDVPSEERF